MREGKEPSGRGSDRPTGLPGIRVRLARLLVRLASLMVPSGRREEWLGEWRGELAALERFGRAPDEDGEGPRLSSPSTRPLRPAHARPGMLAFALGAIPHALWTLKEGWTLDSLIQDLGFGARMLRRTPGFALVAALTLALGIGANASIFSLVDALLFRSPSGVRSPESLVQIARSYESDPRWDNFSWPAMELIRREASTLEGVAGYYRRSFVLGRGADTEEVPGRLVTGNFFRLLGAQPFLGRLLLPSDDLHPGAHPVIVLSHALWERRYGSDPDIVGRSVLVGTEPYEIMGVAPPGFAGVETVTTPPALWIPTMQHPGYFDGLPFDRWGASWISLVGRLREGVSVEEARASMDAVAARLREANPVNEEILVLLAQGVGLDPEERQEARQLSFVLFVVVGVVLLLACVNVANLFLSRASDRGREVGVRMALGAGRGRLVRQLVTESFLVALLATALALPLLLLGGKVIPRLFPYPLTVSVEPDLGVFLFLAGMGGLTGILFGIAPAWSTSRRSPAGVLKEGSATEGGGRTRLRDSLVVAQLALSLGLVAAAALLGRSVINASTAEPGFVPEGLSVGFMNLEITGRYDDETGTRLLRRLVAAANEIPGVRSATVANQAPLVGAHSRSTVRPAGRDDVGFEAERNVVGPRYFETLGVALLRGRSLAGPETETGPVVVVNQALAELFWPGEDPIGKELQGEPNRRVVGLVADVQMRNLRSRGRPSVYYPLSGRSPGRAALFVRSQGGDPVSAAALRRAVASVDPELPVPRVVDLHQALAASMGETRTIGILVGIFAVLALVLASVGLYGLVSYGVARRVREMGIRLALGAEPRSLVRLVMRRGLAVAVVGVGMGLGVSLLLSRTLRGLLFGISPGHVPTLAGAGFLLLATAALAAWVPARRASRVDAAVSLREE